MIAPRRSPQEARRTALRAEVIGTIILVLIGFVIAIIRYGRFIDWHAK